MLAGVAHAQCPGDVDGDGRVTVDEIVSAVDAGLNGCGERGLESLGSLSLRLAVGDSNTVARYRLADAPTVTDGIEALSGTNTATGASVRIGLFGDGYDFVMFEPTSRNCFATVFNVVRGRVFGELAVYNTACSAPAQSVLYSVVGNTE